MRRQRRKLAAVLGALCKILAIRRQRERSLWYPAAMLEKQEGRSGHVQRAEQVSPLPSSPVRCDPVRGEGTEGVIDSNGKSVSTPSTRRAVMIVDDDDAIREALEDVLSDEGYEVVGLSDGQQALDYLHAEKRPSAILVDLWMPVMDGWKFLEALLDDPRFSRIPLIVLTAARDQRARDLRVSEVLTKPVQLQQVLGALERLTKVS